MKLVIRGLNKNYGAKVALQDFHAVFENGIYGILGPLEFRRVLFRSGENPVQ